MRCLPRQLLLALLASPVLAADVEIVVVDSATAQPIRDAVIACGEHSAPTDSLGKARFDVPEGGCEMVVSHVAYASGVQQIDQVDESIRIALTSRSHQLPIFQITASSEFAQPGRTELSARTARQYPSPAPDPLRVVKALPGVTSGNERTSNYNTNGGNYDQNLLYINGVEFEIPLLLRNGLSETVSPVNPDMAGGLEFHSGVLPARFGDKLSSLVAVDYQLPDSTLEGRASASRRAQSLTLSDALPGGVRVVAGVRRVDLSALTDGLQTSGKFAPQFRDWQALATWSPQHRHRTSVFTVVTDSDFNLVPDQRVLRYNCRYPPRGRRACDELRASGEGRESFHYGTRVLGIEHAVVRDSFVVAFRGHVFESREAEDTDLLYETEWRPASRPETSIRYLNIHETHRSHLDMTRRAVSLDVRRARQRLPWAVGIGWQDQRLDGSVSAEEQWIQGQIVETVDSANQGTHRRFDSLFTYGEGTWQRGRNTLQSGIRLVRFGSSKETLLLPRLALGRQISDRWRLLMSSGLAAQPPLYRETLATVAGSTRVRSQKAYTLTVGAEVTASPALHWKAESYYRYLWDAISFETDDLQIAYSGRNDSVGYAYGLNLQARGQISQLLGMINYNFLVTREDLESDALGYRPRPTDQRHTISAYLEDRMDVRVGCIRDSVFHIRLLYGSGFPSTPKIEPGSDLILIPGPRNSRAGNAYFRFDIGSTQRVRVFGLDLELREEVANIFDQCNTVGFEYLPAPDGSVVELRNGLGRRVFSAILGLIF